MISRRLSLPTHNGMTVLELLLAITMLLVFTGVVVMVSGTIIRFLSPMNQVNANGPSRSNGLLIDQMELRRTMRRLVSVLEQPGISRAQLLGFQTGVPAIAHAQSVDPDDACVVDPVGVWNLPLPIGNLAPLPPGYRVCLWSTSIQEPTLQQLQEDSDSSPGIYVLQALPEQLTTRHLPIRLMFCRPKPFC